MVQSIPKKQFLPWDAGHSYYGASMGPGLSYQALLTGFAHNRALVQGYAVVRNVWVKSIL